MVLWIRMRDGKELRVECESIETSVSTQTGCLTQYKIEGVKGRNIPIYMPPGDIALIWRENGGEES